MSKNIIDALNWRYATKEYDKEKKLNSADLEKIKESLRLSASSFGLQPWKFIVVSNPEIRTKLRAAAWDQTPITDASNLIVLAVNTKVDVGYVDMFVNFVSKVRGAPVEALKGYSDMMKNTIKSRTPEEVMNWSTKQVYVALGTALTTAALIGVDATPMEGFDPKEFDKILGLEKQGLESRIVLALGYRSKNDKSANYKKVRFSREEVFIDMK